MIYKIAIVSCKQLFQTWKNGSFMNANQHTGYFTGSNHEYTLSEHTAGAHDAKWLHLDTFPPVQYAPPLSLSPSHLEKSTVMKEVTVLATYTASDLEYTLCEPLK